MDDDTPTPEGCMSVGELTIDIVDGMFQDWIDGDDWPTNWDSNILNEGGLGHIVVTFAAGRTFAITVLEVTPDD